MSGDARIDSDKAEASAAAMPMVGIVVVSYNSCADILRCLASLEQLDYPNYFVVIVDNCSPDSSGRKLLNISLNDRVAIVCSPENSGFAAATNVGLHFARARGADCLWLLNPDTTVDAQALSALVNAAADNAEGSAFGSKILYGSEAGEEVKIWSAGARIDFVNRHIEMCGSGETDRGQYDAPYECDYLPGCSLFIRAAVLDEVGYLPERYFMYFEETDWCVRMRQKSLRLRYVPQSLVWHHFDDRKMQEAFGVYYYNRNERFFWFRYGTITQRFALVTKTLFRDLPRALRALWYAPDAQLRAVFRAHTASAFDFLCGRSGRRVSWTR
ncbi:MAG TPA: glycosyltransferase family 2 protein [Oligoflexia bacterium]|nr:glycosyltransferase family 2 protein [Oligoflexia bacterium]